MSIFRNVNVVSYHVKDWKKAMDFYQKVLGWPVAYVNEEMGWVEIGEEDPTHIAISRWDDREPIPPYKGRPTAALGVEDAIKTTEDLRALGVRCDDAVTIPGVVCFGTFYDPEGNRIQFAS
jgi:predicted enzyme related to lactoylglutathione lyase